MRMMVFLCIAHIEWQHFDPISVFTKENAPKERKYDERERMEKIFIQFS
jgi:hypothetical protein